MIKMQEAVLLKCSLPQFALPFLKLEMHLYYYFLYFFVKFPVNEGVFSIRLVLFLIAIASLTKLGELEKSKVRDKTCDPVNKL